MHSVPPLLLEYAYSSSKYDIKSVPTRCDRGRFEACKSFLKKLETHSGDGPHVEECTRHLVASTFFFCAGVTHAVRVLLYNTEPMLDMQVVLASNSI